MAFLTRFKYAKANIKLLSGYLAAQEERVAGFTSKRFGRLLSTHASQDNVISRLSARTSSVKIWEKDIEPALQLVDDCVAKSIEELQARRSSVPHWSSAFVAVRDIATSKHKHLLRPQLVFLGFAVGCQWTDWSSLHQTKTEAWISPLVRFAAGVELQHLFMFVHDDMMDHAMMRRGHDTIQVAVNRTDRHLHASLRKPQLQKEGVQHLTTLVGDVLQAKSHQLIAHGERELMILHGAQKYDYESAMEIVMEGCLRAGAAQFEDILGWSGVEHIFEEKNDYRSDFKELSNQTLEKFLEDKASFHSFAAPLISGLRLSRNISNGISAHEHAELEASCQEWARHVGAAFQGIDDVIDFVLEIEDSGKDRLQDITEGRVSLPLFLLRQRATPDEWKLVYGMFGSYAVLIPAERQQLLHLMDKYYLQSSSLEFVTKQIDRANEILSKSVIVRYPLLKHGLGVFMEGLVEVTNSLQGHVK